MLYTRFFLEKERNGLEILKCTRRTDRAKRSFLCVLAFVAPSMGSTGGSLRAAGSLVRRFLNLLLLPTPLENRVRGLTVQGINNAKHHHVYTLPLPNHPVLY